MPCWFCRGSCVCCCWPRVCVVCCRYCYCCWLLFLLLLLLLPHQCGIVILPFFFSRIDGVSMWYGMPLRNVRTRTPRVCGRRIRVNINASSVRRGRSKFHNHPWCYHAKPLSVAHTEHRRRRVNINASGVRRGRSWFHNHTDDIMRAVQTNPGFNNCSNGAAIALIVFLWLLLLPLLLFAIMELWHHSFQHDVLPLPTLPLPRLPAPFM